MTLVSRIMEYRASPENPSTSLSNPDSWLYDALGANKTNSGTRINEATALNLSAVWAAVRVLTDTVASIPIHVYRHAEGGGKRREPSNPVYRLLHDRPNPEMSAFTFKEVLQGHLALWGNAYAEKERNGRGDVVALWPITPSRVTPRWVKTGGGVKKVFEVQVGDDTKYLGTDTVMHIPGFGYDGLVGYSPIRMARESLGLTKAAEDVGALLFGQGLRAGGVLSHPRALNDIARENLKRSIDSSNGGLENFHRVMLLEEGLTWTQTSIPPEDAQFLETRKFQTVEVARWFKVPPHKIGDLERATFSNIEHQSIEFATDTARPWFIRWEQVLNWELFNDSDRGEVFAEFNMDGLLRGDTASRGAFYTSMFNVGAISQNEIREKENANPIEGGDRYYIQGALVPSDKVDAVIDARQAPKALPAPSDIGRMRPVLLDAAERVVRREIDSLRAAIKRGDVETWADGFYYEDQAGFAAKRFLPACLAVNAANGVQLAGSFGADWASRSLAEIRRAVKAGDDLDALARAWEVGRAEEWVRSVVNSKEGTDEV
jgi:HK97 family phage portal protein